VSCVYALLCSFDTLQKWVQQFARLRPGSLARSVAHYVMLPQSWGQADPAVAAPAASAVAGPTGRASTPAFVVSHALIAESCFLPGDAYGKIGTDIDMFLEQSVIAVGVGVTIRQVQNVLANW
jgi:hypothetical protein